MLGQFDVIASKSHAYTVTTESHAYAEEGHYTVTTVITDTDADHVGAAVTPSTTTAVSSALVSDPAVIATGGFTVNAGIQLDSGLQTVATFTDPGGAEDPNVNYTATINWGDSSPTSAGVITLQSGVFTVQGDHTYSSPNPHSYTITVTIDHESSTPQTVTSTANVVAPTIALSGTSPVNEASLFTLTLGAITDPSPAEQSQITGYVINWGDSAQGDNNPFEMHSFSGTWNPGSISWTHTYEDGPASDTIDVTLIDASGSHSDAGTLNVTKWTTFRRRRRSATLDP